VRTQIEAIESADPALEVYHRDLPHLRMILRKMEIRFQSALSVEKT